MLGKICAGAKGGASSSGLTQYLVGYAVAGKGASRDEIAAAIDAVELEAESRGDRGVGQAWSPTAGHGTRPSSILALRCESYATFAAEVDSDAAIEGAVDNSAMHFVWSWSTAETAGLSDDQVLQYAQDSLEKIGLAEHRALLVVHRDTIVRDPLTGQIIDGNVHVHAAVGSVHPVTGIKYDNVKIYGRLARADREIEMAHGLSHDRGLYVVRDPHTTEARIEEATLDERKAWRHERREERLVSLERRSAEGYQKRDKDFGRYANATVAPRLRAAMETARDRGRGPDWATLHAVSARYGCELQTDAQGRVILRDVGVGELRHAHSKIERTTEREMESAGKEREEIDAALAVMRAEHGKSQVAERDRKRDQGDTITLDAVLDDDRTDMPEFQALEEAEDAVIARVEQHPEDVLQDLTAEQSTFTRSDVDRWLATRISDPEAMERLGDLVVGHGSVRALEIDTKYPLLTTTEILDIEGTLHDDARELSHRESGFDAKHIDAAMRKFERKQGNGFRLSDEQRKALLLMERGSLVAIEGLPGVGKTTIQGAVRVLGEQLGREVVGLTLSQAAAERLESEAGFRSVNTARARIMEEGGEQVIPHRGIVVIDEAGMVDSRAMQRIIALAKERESVVLAIGDTRQLQPIDAGASFRIVREVARESKTYTELRDVQRQKRDWHRQSVIEFADALVEKNDEKRLALVKSALQRLEEHGAIRWKATRDEAIDEAVKSARAYRAAGLHDTLILGADKDTVRHLSEEDRRRDGREGAGRTYTTKGGDRELAPGDRFAFLENSLTGKRALGVRNGDTGTVVMTESSRIGVKLDREDRVVEFSTRSYKTWDHGNAMTVHKSQGASVSAGVVTPDRSATAELLFVALSRSQHGLDIIPSRESFTDLDDLAKHVSNRISLKTTTRTYEEELARTGGAENLWAKKMARADEQRENPMRKRWQGEIVEPMLAVRRERLKDSSLLLKTARDVARKEGEGISERLKRDRELLHDAKIRNGIAIKETTPPSFRAWNKEQEREAERMRERQHEKTQQRNAERHRERSARAKNQERDYDYDHGYER